MQIIAIVLCMALLLTTVVSLTAFAAAVAIDGTMTSGYNAEGGIVADGLCIYQSGGYGTNAISYNHNKLPRHR